MEKVKVALLTAVFVVLPACHEVKPLTNGCEWVKPIYVSCEDALTKGTADQIYAHDLAGAKICGWKPKKGASCPASPSR